MRRTSTTTATLPFAVKDEQAGRIFGNGFAELVGDLAVAEADALVFGRIATFFRFGRGIRGQLTVLQSRATGRRSEIVRVSVRDLARNTLVIEGQRATYNGTAVETPRGTRTPIQIFAAAHTELEDATRT